MLPAEQRIEVLASPPFPCPNCDKPTPNMAALFCSELCKQEAGFVRYYRARAAERRLGQEDIKNAIEIKLGLILGGGYPERAREVPDRIRDAVIARDNGRCCNCGGPGSDVDHIEGSSSDLNNLQYLCRSCHNEKTRSRFRKIRPDTHPEQWAKYELLLGRARSPQPLRICDQADWDSLRRNIERAKKDGPQQSLFG